MKFSRIYREAARFWPTTIEISDGELREGNGGYFPALSKCWSEAENHASHWSEWHKVMVWAIFCCLHRMAVHAKRGGKRTISKQDIDKLYVEMKFSESIFFEYSGYPRQIRSAYINDLPREGET